MHPFSRLHRGIGRGLPVRRRDIHQSSERAVAHGPPVVDGPLFSATRGARHFVRAPGLEVNRIGPGQFDQRFGRDEFSGLRIQHVEKAVLGRGHGNVPLLAIDDQVGDQDVIVLGLQSRGAGLEMPGVFSGLRIHSDDASGKKLVPRDLDR